MNTATPPTHPTVTRELWLEQRAALLALEKEHTRAGDELARRRRELPWVKVEKRYTLKSADGERTLPELFDGRSQLLIYHFMFGPAYESGCPVNSSIADSFDALIPHLTGRDVTLIALSGAPIERLLAYRERMGWGFDWVSSYESDLGVDLGFSSTVEDTRAAFGADLAGIPAVAFRNAEVCGTDIYGYLTERFGFTAFLREGEAVYQTYTTTGRGVEFLMPYYGFLDRAPRGRDEGEDDWQLWIRRRDEYDGS